jgi:DNA-binding response OmpR family regulator
MICFEIPSHLGVWVNPPVALIVEDDPEAGELLEIVLGAAGLIPFVVESGGKALSLMAASVPDLVVLDLNLPDVPGVEVLRDIRADPRSAETPVIVVTAHPQVAQVVWEEANLVLVRPIPCDVLKRKAVALVRAE